MKMSSSILILLAGAVAFASTGCSGNDKAISFNSGGMTHTFSEGKDAVPNNFPIPIYPKAVPAGSVATNGEGDENSKFVMLTSDDPVDKVSDFYNKALSKDGWKVSTNNMLPTLVNISAHKDQMEGSVMLSAGEDKKTSISLAVGKEPEGTPKVTNQVFSPDKLNPPTD